MQVQEFYSPGSFHWTQHTDYTARNKDVCLTKAISGISKAPDRKFKQIGEIMVLWKRTLPFYISTSSGLNENAPRMLRASVILSPFKRPPKYHAGGTASLHWTLSMKKWWQVSYALSAAYNLEETLLHNRRCWVFSVLRFSLYSHEGRSTKRPWHLQEAT